LNYITPQQHIHSIAFSFSKLFILDIKAAHELHVYYPAYRLLYYGNTGILVISGAVFNPLLPILMQITKIFSELIKKNILHRAITLYDIRIHEIELRYTFLQCQPFICKTAGFRKVENRYLSRDYRQIYRSNGELKGTRKSSLCVQVNGADTAGSLIFNITGQKCRYLSLMHLAFTVPQLFESLKPLLVCFLTQATNPSVFNIQPSYLHFIDPRFLAIFNNAGWFSDSPFVKQRISQKLRGGGVY
jgi:hypothetical protein